MDAQQVIEKQNRIVIARSLRKTLRKVLADKDGCFVVAVCSEQVITQYLQKVPDNYEEILSYAVSDVVLELSSLLRKEGEAVTIHARIKKRRSVVITVSF